MVAHMDVARMELNNTVYQQGGGVPLVLLHAFPIDHRMWDGCVAQLMRLARSRGLEPFPIWAPDMPGAGEGPIPDAAATGAVAPDGAYTEALDRLADAYVGLLRGAGFAKAIWVGLSMGGYEVLDVQRLHPDAVAGLALCDTKAGADSPASRASRLGIARACEDGHNLDGVMHFAQPQPGDSTVKRSETFVRTMADWIHEQRPQGVAWRERTAAGRPDLNAQLPLITAPAALVSGVCDPSSPPDAMRPMVSAMTGTDPKFTQIEDCGHFSAVEHPAAVAVALLDLVIRVNGQTS